MSWSFIYFLLSLLFFRFVRSSDNYTSNTLDTFLQEYAFKTLVRHRPHTGALYKAMLPANLTGMDVSIVRLRSQRLWNRGANFSNIHIPPRSIPLPHVRRLALVYQDFGNWSSRYYSVPGYSMISSVVGFTVFDASNVKAKRVSKLGLKNTVGKPIAIRFLNSTLLPGEMVSRARCVAFGNNGIVKISEMSVTNVCYSRNQGHFSIVVPTERKQRRRRVLWYLWVSGTVLGFGGLILIGNFVMASLKLLKTKKVQVMERKADEASELDTKWIGRSRMPSATVTRTQPTLEDGAFP